MILKGKNVIITGGSKGIGLEMTKILLEKGAAVCVLSRSKPGIKHTNLLWYKADLAKDFPELTGSFDIAILNVGVNPGPVKFNELSDEELEKTLYLNLNIHLKVIRKIECKKIVFVDSVLSMAGLPGNSIYCACKSFIKTFNEALRREGHDTYIIYPYKINTSLFPEIKDFFTLDKEYVARVIIRDIEKGRRERVLPWIFNLVPLLNSILPTSILDWVSSFIIEFLTTKSNKKD